MYKRGFTDVELHQGMKQMVVRELGTRQGIPQDSFRAMVHWPCTMEQERNQLCLQIGILDIIGVGEKANTQCHSLVADC